MKQEAAPAPAGGENIELGQEVWDDSLLINAWEKALNVYQEFYLQHFAFRILLTPMVTGKPFNESYLTAISKLFFVEKKRCEAISHVE